MSKIWEGLSNALSGDTTGRYQGQELQHACTHVGTSYCCATKHENENETKT